MGRTGNFTTARYTSHLGHDIGLGVREGWPLFSAGGVYQGPLPPLEQRAQAAGSGPRGPLVARLAYFLLRVFHDEFETRAAPEAMPVKVRLTTREGRKRAGSVSSSGRLTGDGTPGVYARGESEVLPLLY